MATEGTRLIAQLLLARRAQLGISQAEAARRINAIAEALELPDTDQYRYSQRGVDYIEDGKGGVLRTKILPLGIFLGFDDPVDFVLLAVGAELNPDIIAQVDYEGLKAIIEARDTKSSRASLQVFVTDAVVAIRSLLRQLEAAQRKLGIPALGGEPVENGRVKVAFATLADQITHLRKEVAVLRDEHLGAGEPATTNRSRVDDSSGRVKHGAGVELASQEVDLALEHLSL